MKDRNATVLRYKSRVYRVTPDFALVCGIEHELGSLPQLRESFSCDNWKICDLVTLVQMLLQAAGETVDYLVLGNDIVQEGTDPYLAAVTSFLNCVMQAGKA